MEPGLFAAHGKKLVLAGLFLAAVALAVGAEDDPGFVAAAQENLKSPEISAPPPAPASPAPMPAPQVRATAAPNQGHFVGGGDAAPAAEPSEEPRNPLIDDTSGFDPAPMDTTQPIG